MNRVINRSYALFAIILFLFVLIRGNADAEMRPVGLLISSEIRPFVMMVKGFESAMDRQCVRIFFDSDGRPFSRDPLFRTIEDSDFSAVVAIGPRALSYLDEKSMKGPLFYSMVLNPASQVSGSRDLCGVSLDIFSLDQLSTIHALLPEMNRIGVVFNPSNNQKWFNAASTLAKISDLKLVPLKVTKESEIKSVFMEKPLFDALLFIPDPTVISRPLIRYMIKRAFYFSMPTIGYNRFFHESGSAMSFDIDYTKVGIQTAGSVNLFLKNGECRSTGPGYRVLINRKVIQALEIKIPDRLPDNVEVE